MADPAQANSRYPLAPMCAKNFIKFGVGRESIQVANSVRLRFEVNVFEFGYGTGNTTPQNGTNSVARCFEFSAPVAAEASHFGL